MQGKPTMAKTIDIGRDEAVTIAPALLPVRGDLPVKAVQMMFRRGVLCIDRHLTVTEAREIACALLDAAGEGEA